MASPGEHAAVELHDSRVDRIRRRREDCILVLSGYVHRSSGTPGVSPGSAWSQTVLVRCLRARLLEEHEGLPIWLSQGRLSHRDGVVENLIPVPSYFPGPVQLELAGFEGEHLLVEADSVELALDGDPTYVEEFPG